MQRAHRRTAVPAALAGAALTAVVLAGAPSAPAAPPGVTVGDHYRVTNALTGLAVAVRSASSAVDARVVQSPVDITSTRQDWQVRQGPGGFELRNAASATCLSLDRDSRAAGAHLVQRDCRAAAGQLWTLQDGAVEGTAGLRSVLSGWFVDVPGGTLAPDTWLQVDPGSEAGGRPGAHQSFYLVRVDV
jgi:hypothetical protein